MKITTAIVRDFKRIREVTVSPDADRFLLLVGGNNAQGKSSLLDALTAAFGGKGALPAEAVRRGAERAEIVVELDGGRYRIARTVAPSGDSKLEVTGPDGRIAKPQAWLDQLVAARFLDPLAFLSSSPKEQRKTLAALVGLDLDGFERERKALYDERTATGRVLIAAQAELGRLPAPTPRPPEARSQATIRADLDAIEAERLAMVEEQARRRMVRAAHKDLTTQADRLRAEIERLQGQLATLEQRIEVSQRALDLDTASAEPDPGKLDARCAELRKEAVLAEQLARWEATHEALAGRRRAAEEQVARQAAERDRLTAALEAVDQRRAAALAAAEMPVPDLGVTDDGLTLAGIPFDQASQSERLRTALAIAMRLSPNIRDIWIRDGSLLDEDALAELHTQAMFADCRLWIERVGERDEGAIVIRDGRVAGEG